MKGGFFLPAAVVEIILERENCAERPLNITLVVALNPQPLVMLVYYCICEPKMLVVVINRVERQNWNSFSSCHGRAVCLLLLLLECPGVSGKALKK